MIEKIEPFLSDDTSPVAASAASAHAAAAPILPQRPATVAAAASAEAPPPPVIFRNAKNVVFAPFNQYTGRRDVAPSVCTSCSAAFLVQMIQNKPVNIPTIRISIDEGRKAHIKATGNTSDNLSADEVLAKGGLALQRADDRYVAGTIDRGTADYYLQNFINPYLNPTIRGTGSARVIFVHAPYSLAIVGRRSPTGIEYLVFDSHGQAVQGQNRAFIATFDQPETLAQFLAEKYPFIPPQDGWDNSSNDWEATFCR